MAGKVKTYEPKQVLISLGTHSVTGYAEDSFVNLEPNGDGITDLVGCDGEQVRSIDPDDTWNITLTLLQTSVTNKRLQSKSNLDKSTGEGMFPVTIKDLRGGVLFSCEEAWVVKPVSRPYGRSSQNREWTIRTGTATMADD